MAASTWTWLGISNDVTASANWQLTSGPGNGDDYPAPGDTALFTGTGVAPEFQDTDVTGGTTFDLTGSGAVTFFNDTSTATTGSIDPGVLIDAAGTATLLTFTGPFTNAGTIEVSGTANTLTIAIGTNAPGDGGLSDNGQVLVDQGGTANFSSNKFGIILGSTLGSSGTLTVQDGGLLTDASGANVGSGGYGLAQVLNGGTIQLSGTNGISVGASSGSTGSLLVSGTAAGGAPSKIILNGTAKGLSAGQSGTGTIDVESDGTIQMNGTGGISVGQSANAVGVLIVNGPGALINQGAAGSGAGIAQGTSSSGSVLVEDGGTLELNGTAGGAAFGLGQATGARGTLDLENGGSVDLNGGGSVLVGQTAGAGGMLIVNGTSTVLNEGTASGGMTVGNSGTGTLEIEGGGAVTLNGTNNGGLRVGQSANGLVLVSGADSLLTLNTPNNPAAIGINSTGTLEVEAGGSVSLGNALGIGFGSGGNGQVTVTGTGSAITLTGSTGALDVGAPAAGALSILAGGSVAAAAGVFIASNSVASQGTVTVTGGTLTTPGQIAIGNVGTGALTVGTGGLVQLTGGTGSVLVGGVLSGGKGALSVAGGVLNDSGGLTVGGSNVSGTLTVSDGGQLSSGNELGFTTIDASGAGTAAATVSDGTWTVSDPFFVGGGAAVSANGSLDISEAGLVNAGTNSVVIGVGANGPGTASLESGGALRAGSLDVGSPIVPGASALLSIAGGTVSATSLTEGVGGSIVLSSGSLGVSGDTSIGGVGGAALNMSGGTMTTATLLIGATAAVTSAATVSGGALTMSGLIVGAGGGGSLTVSNGARVVNSGAIGIAIGAVSIENDVPVGCDGTVTLNGGTLSDTGGFFAVGTSNANGSLVVEAAGSLITGGTGGASADISATDTDSATATVSGGSWTANNSLVVGDTGVGSLDINSGGSVDADNWLVIGERTGGAGTVSLESGGSLRAGLIAIANAISFGSTGLLAVAGGSVTAMTLTESQGGTVSISSGALSVSGGATIGQNGTGAALSQTGGAVSVAALTVGQNSGSSGTVSVSGGTLTANGTLLVGASGGGVVNVTAGGSLVTAALDVGAGPGMGDLTIDGGAATDTGQFAVGMGGIANAEIEGGGSFIANGTSTGISAIAIGNAIGGSGMLTVSDGSMTGNGENLLVGDNGNGALLVENAGTVTTSAAGGGPAVDVDAANGDVASATVTGALSQWDLTSTGATFNIGDSGGGSLTVSGGGAVNAGTNEVVLGVQAGGSGSVTVSDGGTLTAATQSSSSAALEIGAAAGGSGALTVTGTGAEVTATGAVNVGDSGGGDVLIASQGTLRSGAAAISPGQGFTVGLSGGGIGAATVTGSGSSLINTGLFTVGDAGLGSLAIDAGATVETTPGSGTGLAGAVIASAAGASGSSVDVTGAGSNWQVGGSLIVGAAGAGALSLSRGGSVTAASLDAASASGGSGQIGVVGAGSDLIVSGTATIAEQSAATMSILNGGSFQAAYLNVGLGSATGAIAVGGPATDFHITNDMTVGHNGVFSIGNNVTVFIDGNFNEIGAVNQGDGSLIDPSTVTNASPHGGGGSSQIVASVSITNNSTYFVGDSNNGAYILTTPLITGTGVLEADPANNAGAEPDLVLNTGSIGSGQTLVFGSGGAAEITLGSDNGTTAISGLAAGVRSFFTGDTIVVTTTAAAGFQMNGSVVSVVDNVGGATEGSLVFASASLASTAFDNSGLLDQVECFAAGTRIATDRGPVAVEDLAVGDRVVTADGAVEPIVWIGQRTVDCARHPRPETVWPVRVAAGAFGGNVPVRDLYLSPDHAVFAGGVLVPVKLLIDGTTIARVPRARVSYFHVELPRHAVILAEGLAVESYLDVGDRADFRDGDGAIRLFPDFATRLAPDAVRRWETLAAAPLVLRGPRLAAARGRVTDRGCAGGVSLAGRPRAW